MRSGVLRSLPVLALAAAISPSTAHTTSVVVKGTPSHTIPPTLWGLMYEPTFRQSGDGGLYAELLQNRAFQKVIPGSPDSTLAWHAINSSIEVTADYVPLSDVLPNALQLVVPVGSTGPVGVGNEGYWGIHVNSSWTYSASFYYRFPYARPSSPVTATISLVSTTGTVFGSVTTQLAATASWTQASVSLRPSHSAPNIANNFTLTFDGETLADYTINLALFSLFPPTFQDQSNGIRKDIAEALLELEPSFFRFPGGNNLGHTVDTRWQWNATVGPLTARPGRFGDWGYVNSDGLGILEYLTWIESMGMQSIMAVWSGYTLNGASLAPDQLGPYIEQARQQIEFVVGGTNTTGGALRASLGREKPFTLNFVEIGNEDWFSDTYPGRWPLLVGNLSAAFPDIRFLATTNPWTPELTPTPKSFDVHVYSVPGWFNNNTFYYDDFERNGTTYFEGEYAAISVNPDDIFGERLPWPTVETAVSEAAFMTGLERNSDIVFAASYAPLLAHINGSQWTPNLITFDAGSVVRSTSYYVQKFFSVNRGDAYLPSTLPSRNGTVFWSVTKKNSPASYIIKISNTVSTPASLSFQLPSNVHSEGTAQVLTGPKNASNVIGNANVVVPKTSTIKTGRTTNYNAPGFSVTVLTIPVA
ncbi:glycoside hydrolase family 51 protein [Auriscalpium vulgare]|uniref:Glycoside hydrolase family 51 protein n=1 Tax=Auriscalpium vulgare TaxID=40419 RepID=A0ACB8R8W5_9AGAM|nr:glycoside hydrolase family 51 protein [Auriscalpium vulgare]